MARKRISKTGLTREEWKQKFRQAVYACRTEARRRGIRFQDCIREKLKHY